jgi:putative membrane protein
VRRKLLCITSFVVTLLAGCAVAPPGVPLPPISPGLEWVTFLLVVVAGLVWLTRNGVGQYWPRGSGTDSSRAYDVLRERYAKGEISREEYLRVASDLEAHGRPHRR